MFKKKQLKIYISEEKYYVKYNKQFFKFQNNGNPKSLCSYL